MCALRQEKMKNWLADLPAYDMDLSTVSPASSDASFRRYFRVTDLASHASFVVMDAPPDKENTPAFVAVAKLLSQAQVHAPQILAQDLDNGFLLLDDLGGTTLLQALQGELEDFQALYGKAIDILVTMQSRVAPTGLGAYSPEKLQQEMDLFEEWYVRQHHQSVLTDAEKNSLVRVQGLLVQSALGEGQVFVHRDYHSRNLMFLPAEADRAFDLGVLDFQDAVAGPLSYDLVSLLRDAYIEWPEEVTLDRLVRYWEKARLANLPVPHDVSDFYRQFDWMGLQRHLKVLGIFARLNHRDGKSQYLQDLPLVLAYVRHVAARYSVFKPLLLLLDRLENKAQQVGYTF